MGEGLICRGHNSLPYVKDPSCMVCGKEVDSEERELCLDCEKHSRNFERGFPVFNYMEPVKASVLAIKYHNKKNIVISTELRWRRRCARMSEGME